MAPAALTLGDQRVGVASGAQEVPLQNSGAAALKITGVTVSGPNASDVALLAAPTEAMPLQIAAMGAGSLPFTFKPGGPGPRVAQLVLASNDPMKPSVTVALSGRGVVAGFMSSPASLTFARQRTGGCGPGQLVRIDNPGTDRLRITSLTFSGAEGSSFRTSATPSSVAPGATIYVDVSACPQKLGALAGTLVIATDYMPGHKAEVALSGVGYGPLVQVAPTFVDFGKVYAGQTSQQSVTIKNAGDEDTTLALVALQGPGAGQFTLSPPAPGMRLAAGATVSATVTARPSAAGPIAADLVISLAEDLVPGKELRVPLSGSGVVATLSAGPMTIDCGARFVGVSGRCGAMLTVRNTGEEAVEGLMVQPTLADFRVESVPQTLGPMAEAQLPISFRPTQAGARSGALVIRGKGVLMAAQVAISGRGQSLSLQLSTDALDFGAVTIGEGASRQVVLINQGDAALEVDAAPEPSAPEASEFVADPPSLSLAPGEPQTLTVRFAPVVAGDKALPLQINIKDGGAAVATVDLTARAFDKIAPPMMAGCALSGPGAAGRKGQEAAAGLGAFALLGLVAALRHASRARR